MDEKIPIICLVGPSSTGKTTTIETIIRHMPKMNFATVKFTHHQKFSLNPTAKDNQRHLNAGAVVNLSFAPSETGIMIPTTKRLEFSKIDDIIKNNSSLLPSIDAILCESYNKPPNEEHVWVILSASTKQDIDEYIKYFSRSKLIAITGKIGKQLDRFDQIPVVNIKEKYGITTLTNTIKSHIPH